MKKQVFYFIMIALAIFMATISKADTPYSWQHMTTKVIMCRDSMVTYQSIFERQAQPMIDGIPVGCNHLKIIVVFRLPQGVLPENGLPTHPFSSVAVKVIENGVVVLHRRESLDGSTKVTPLRDMRVEDLRKLLF